MTIEHEILTELRSLRTLIETRCRQPGKPWTLEEAAAFLGRSRTSLHTWIAEGRILAIKHGRMTSIPDAEVQRLATEGTGRVRIAQTDGIAQDASHKEVS
jgi:excisionase family DNA binding protein